MRGPAETGHGGVSMAGGCQGHDARKGEGVRGRRVFLEEFFMYSAFCLDREVASLANMRSVMVYSNA